MPELGNNRWQRLGRDLRALPLPQAGRLLFRRASKSWRARHAAGLARRQITAIDAHPASFLTSNQSLAAFLLSKFSNLHGFPILPEQANNVANSLHLQFPGWAKRCLDEANRICGNRVSLLGHEIVLDDPPTWHKDHLSGAVWPAGPSASSCDVRMNQGADIKFVWELSRFHYGVTLGRAFVLTEDERFARKFVSFFSDWRKVNPLGIGPNWTCAMEVAIRAVNLLWAGSLLASSKAFDQPTREAFVKTLLAHGTFIYHNLECDERVVGRSLQPVNGNHYLADLAGLLHISLAFPEYRHALEWQEFTTQELFKEIRLQIDDEGVHWEYSPSYHRLVTEMILSCLILLEHHSESIPNDIRQKVIQMLEFICHYRKPSGRIPLVRDIDNGRFCILGGEELTRHDHLLALGAIYFGRPDLYPGTLYEDCLWHLGPLAYEWQKRHTTSGFPQETTGSWQGPFSGPPTLDSQLSTASKAGDAGNKGHNPEAAGQIHTATGTSELWSTSLPESSRSKLFRHSGFCVMRQDSLYLLALCCPKGMKGYCGHTHNDLLSFELEAYGRTFLTDCGSYVYTQSPEWRNHFRSTSSHNTVVVDGQEQNRFNSSHLFEIDSTVRPEIRHWASNDAQDDLVAAYSLTMPDGTELTHERRFVFRKDRALWVLRDRIIGTGQHTIETRFHFAEGIAIAPAPVPRSSPLHPQPTIYRTLCDTGPNLFLLVAGPGVPVGHVERNWISRSYAAKTEVNVLRFAVTAGLPFEQSYVLVSTRNGDLASQDSINELNCILRTANASIL